MAMKMSGIYSIRNTITGDVYVGQAINLVGRWEVHFRLLSKGEHPNRKLQNDFSSYGRDAFVFRREEFCSVERLCELEAHYIELWARPTIRRRRRSGSAGTARGLTHFCKTCGGGGGQNCE